MGFFLSFVVGAATGAMLTWQIDRRRKRHVQAWPARRFSPTAAELWERQEPAAAIVPPASPSAAGAIADDVQTVIVLDRLEHIHGVTPLVARRLNQAGILTYADLARQLPERLQTLVALDEHGEQSVHAWPVHDWIEHARSLAQVDDVL